MEEEDSFPMTGGDGEYSYAKNSYIQREAAERAKESLVSAIVENLDIQNKSPPKNCFRITDLGCSTGPNTYIAVNNIIEAVTQKYKTEGCSSLPEFQVFFNDRVSNDFNILFANLPPNRPYFAAGAPGSFYGRLFPYASLDFVYSAFALQWLSRAPPELADLNSPVCNRGRIYYTNAPDEVGEAYSAQYAKDIGAFLDARAQEVAPGGLMAILIPGRPDGTKPAQASIGPVFHLLESSLVDMVNEGKISKDKLDLFNLPLYSPSTEELRRAIQKNGCFDIARLDLDTPQEAPVDSLVPTVQACRAGCESIITKHFGSEIVQELYDKYANKFAGKHLLCLDNNNLASLLFVLLKRNNVSK